MKKNKKWGFAAAGLAALVIIGGTLAYYSASLTAENKMSTKGYGSELVEKFTPKEDWEPGAEITKNVAAKNTGDYPLLARIKYTDTWSKAGWDADKIQNSGSANQALLATDTVVYNGTHVAKILDAADGSKWVLNTTDGYYYCKQTVLPNSSIKFLDHLILDPAIDMAGTASIAYYYTKSEDEPTEVGTDASTQWVKAESEAAIPADATFKKITSSPAADSYANADYTLSITTEILQATKEAVDGTTGWKAGLTGAGLTTLYNGLPGNN